MAKRRAGGGCQGKFKGGKKSSGKKSTGNTQKKGRHFRGKRKQDTDEEEFAEVDVGYQHEMDESEGEESDKEMDTTKLVTQQNKKKKSGGFQSMGLSHAVFKGVMKKGYRVPTPIQRKTMPLIMDGKDVVAMARTGSGKTAAFLVPMFERLKAHSAKVGARALILSPTRELALQTLKFTKELGRFTGLKAAIILGGDRMEDQFSAIHENPDIIVATPGRFLHIVMEMDLKLNSVEYVVFDEADRLFEMGFAVQLHEIINRLPESRQTLLFSATLPKLLVDFAKAGLTDPALVRLDVDSKLSSQLKLAFFTVRADDKDAVLLNLLQNVIKPSEQTLIFAATRHHVDYLSELLQVVGTECSYVYSTLDPTARKINIGKFQHKKTMVMIVTDVAARGIDIPMLDNVINYNFPAKPKLFIHRVGRVARAGRSGTAYSIVAGDELPYVLDLHLFLGRPLKLSRQSSQQEDSDGLLGAVPQAIVDGEEALLRVSLETSHDLSSLKKVAENGYRQYVKSRPLPSAESVKRAKELNVALLAPHPLLASQTPEETAKADILEGVRNFKPRQTIFEVAATSKTSAQAVMASKRKRHGHVIEKAQQTPQGNRWETERDGSSSRDQETQDEDMEGVFTTVIDPAEKRKKRKKDGSGSAKSFRDENYIPHRASDHYEEKSLGLGLNSFDKEASSAVLDIVADDDSGYRQTKTMKKWDRKRKKFVTIEENTSKKIKTESGARIPASYKRNIYKDWVQKNKLDTRPADEDDASAPHPGNKRGKKGKNGKTFASKGGGTKKGKAELKSKEQILKARFRKENQMQRQQKGRNKGRKFSKRR